MKRIVLLLTVGFVFLMDCWAAADECWHDIWMYCNKAYPECVICGNTFPESKDYDLLHTNTTVNYGDYCQVECQYCGYVEQSYEGHFVSCTDTVSCMVCGTTTLPTRFNVVHLGEDILQGNDNIHYIICRMCGYQRTEKHTVVCSNPTMCQICGATGIEVAIGEQVHDEYGLSNVTKAGHVYRCSTCDYGEVLPHWVHCDNLQYCHFSPCKLEDIEINQYYVEHIIVKDSVTYDEKVHKFECSRCGSVELTHRMWNGQCTEEYCHYQETTLKPGELTGDGIITVSDAIAILQYLSGTDVTINTSNADVNGDGEVDEKDALLILQYDAGWNVTLK